MERQRDDCAGALFAAAAGLRNLQWHIRASTFIGLDQQGTAPPAQLLHGVLLLQAERQRNSADIPEPRQYTNQNSPKTDTKDRKTASRSAFGAEASGSTSGASATAKLEKQQGSKYDKLEGREDKKIKKDYICEVEERVRAKYEHDDVEEHELVKQDKLKRMGPRE